MEMNQGKIKNYHHYCLGKKDKTTLSLMANASFTGNTYIIIDTVGKKKFLCSEFTDVPFNNNLIPRKTKDI